MEFFDRKEEVLELIMTTKGRELFAKGKFSPTYYSFHDSDIIYDNNSTELQNEIIDRIKETPRLKQASSYEQTTSAVTVGEINKNKNYLLGSEIGSKSLGDQYAPAWNVEFLKSPPFQFIGANRNSITDNKKYSVGLSSSIDSIKNSELIPQINISTVYKVYNDYVSKPFFIDSEYFLSNEEMSVYIQQTYFPSTQLRDQVVFFVNEYRNSFQTKNEGQEFNKIQKQKFEQMFADIGDFLSNKINRFSYTSKNNLPEEITSQKGYEFLKYKELERTKGIVYTPTGGVETILGGPLTSLEAGTDEQKQEKRQNVVNAIINLFSTPGFFFPKVIQNTIEQQVARYFIKKDDETLIKINEFNALNSDEFDEYEIEFYVVDYTNYAKKIDNETLRSYINVYFDKLADLQSGFGVYNIYGQQVEVDETTC